MHLEQALNKAKIAAAMGAPASPGKPYHDGTLTGGTVTPKGEPTGAEAGTNATTHVDHHTVREAPASAAGGVAASRGAAPQVEFMASWPPLPEGWAAHLEQATSKTYFQPSHGNLRVGTPGDSSTRSHKRDRLPTHLSPWSDTRELLVRTSRSLNKSRPTELKSSRRQLQRRMPEQAGRRRPIP